MTAIGYRPGKRATGHQPTVTAVKCRTFERRLTAGNPPKTARECADTLAKQGLKKFAGLISAMAG
jgi:hypothetical protein